MKYLPKELKEGVYIFKTDYDGNFLVLTEKGAFKNNFKNAKVFGTAGQALQVFNSLAVGEDFEKIEIIEVFKSAGEIYFYVVYNKF